MVTRIQTPSPFANAQIDFSKIGQLADSYYGAQEGAMKRQAFQTEQAEKEAERARQEKMRGVLSGGIPMGPDGTPDYYKMADNFVRIGGLDEGVKLLGSGEQARERADNRAHRDRSFAADQSYRNQSLGIQREQLTPSEVREYKFYADQERAAGREPMGYEQWGMRAKAGAGPANVQEWKYFNNLSPEDQQRYLTMKRSEKYLDTGTEFVRPNPVSPGQNVATVPKNVAETEAEKDRGKTTAKREAELPGETQRLGMVTGALDRLEKTATDLALSPGLESVAGGLYQTYAPNVFEDARNAGTELENLKVKISGVVLQSMRDMSKTGGAVGQVTEREWPRLENMLANLDPRQGIEQFRRNLQQIVNYTQEVKAQLRAAYQSEFSGTRGYSAPADGANQSLQSARDAIARGAPREAVIQRLRENGIDPSGL